jgi:nucleoside-diphosphate-sugar epimerase
MILLTGSNGFIGSEILKRFRELRVDVSLFSSKELSFVPEFTEISEKIKVIIFCGSYVAHNSNERNDEIQASKSNSIMEFLLGHQFPNLAKVIYLSTCDVYAHDILINENSKVEGNNLYTQTKIGQEAMVRDFCKLNGIDYLISRIGNVYGPGEFYYQKLIPTGINCALREIPFKLEISLSSKIQPIYIYDLVSIIHWLYRNDVGSLILNLVGPKSVTANELIDEISRYRFVDVVVQEFAMEYSRVYRLHRIYESLDFEFTSFANGIREEFSYERERLNIH